MISVDTLIKERLGEIASKTASESGDGALVMAGLACLAIAAVSFANKTRIAKAQARAAQPQVAEAADNEFPTV